MDTSNRQKAFSDHLIHSSSFRPVHSYPKTTIHHLPFRRTSKHSRRQNKCVQRLYSQQTPIPSFNPNISEHWTCGRREGIGLWQSTPPYCCGLWEKAHWTQVWDIRRSLNFPSLATAFRTTLVLSPKSGVFCALSAVNLTSWCKPSVVAPPYMYILVSTHRSWNIKNESSGNKYSMPCIQKVRSCWECVQLPHRHCTF